MTLTQALQWAEKNCTPEVTARLRSRAVVAVLVEEIERLRRLLARYRDETPLGHQPHMIAHQADEALGRGPNS